MIAPIEQIAGNNKLQLIDKLTQKYSEEHQKLAEVISSMEQEMTLLRLSYMNQIRRAVGKAREAKEALNLAILGAPELFARPRTRELHGVKVGFRKGSGGIDWDDDAKVCELIEKHFTKAEADLLIKTTKKPIAKALADLEVTDLKRLGCRVEGTSDLVVIAPTDSEVDKLVKALLADSTEVEA
jgi:hypothetical protein